jgi:thiamine biosynthesis lipoprotein
VKKENIHVSVAIVAVICLAAILFFCIWGKRPVVPVGRIEFDGGVRQIMGTFAHIVAVAADSNTAQRCIEAGFAQLAAIDNSMSDYKSDSELSMVNRDAFKGKVKVSERLFEVLQKSVEFSRNSSGAFDITVGPLVDLWHKAGEANCVPAASEIAHVRSMVGYEKLILDGNDRTVHFAVDGMRLDLGGIAKGYAVDMAAQAMQNCGAIGGMVDAGGNIRLFGCPGQGKDYWLIGLQNPTEARDLNSGKSLLVLKLNNISISTSGDYQRFVTIGGKKFSHIIDTNTGCSSRGLSSVTIIAPDAVDADALSTAVTVMGTEKGLALIETMPQVEAISISSSPEYKIIKTRGAEKFIEH